MKTKSQLIDEFITYQSGKLVEKKSVNDSRSHLRFWVSETMHVIHHYSLKTNNFMVHDDFREEIIKMFNLTETNTNIHLLIWAKKHLKIKPKVVVTASQYTFNFEYENVIH